MSEKHSTPVRVLVAYSMYSTFVQATYDYLCAFKKLAEIDVRYVHITHEAKIRFDFKNYDVIFHNYCARLCYENYVSSDYEQKMQEFDGVKILAVQDEYDYTNLLKSAIRRLGFDIVLTCVPQDSLEYVYPSVEFPDVEFLTVFTGYVPDDFERDRPPILPLEQRAIPIGYRGRDIGGRYGRLGFDKFEIGRRMREICEARGIPCDIAMDEASRIYGMDWFRFIGDCRAMLGTESGSNVFDFDGSIAAKFREMTQENGGIPPSYETFYPFVAERDAQIDMGQISPRIFECALMRTAMVLFRGRYSDVITPGEHYILLEKDFSNVDEVLASLQDMPALEAMTERAYQHLVASGRFGYPAFLRRFLAAAEPLLEARQLQPAERSVLDPTSGPSVSIEDWNCKEQPSCLPGTAADFSLRTNLREVTLYRDEASKLFDEIERLRLIYEAEAQRLQHAYGALYRSYLEIAVAGEVPIERLDEAIFDFSALLPDVALRRVNLNFELDRQKLQVATDMAAARMDEVRMAVSLARDVAKAAYDAGQDDLSVINRIHGERIVPIQAAIADLSTRIAMSAPPAAAEVPEVGSPRVAAKASADATNGGQAAGILSRLKRRLGKFRTPN